MKLYQSTILVLFGLLMAACSRDVADMADQKMPMFEINIVDAGLNPSSRAATDVNYVTTFVNGDKVGLYAVKDGAIVDGVENIALTYTDGKWTPTEPLMYSTEFNGAKFYAYYPYAEESVFDSAAENPFAEKVAQWSIATDISTAELFAENDLMTGVSEAALDSGRYSMTITLSHCLSMLVVELPAVKYTFTNSDVELTPYTVAAVNPTFSVVESDAEQAINPLFVAESSTYRLLVNPNEKYTMIGRFEKNGKSYKYTISFDNGIAAGTYEPFKVDGGIAEKTMELKVGDLFCADGSIVSYADGIDIPEGVVGVVYRIGTTDAIKSACPTCSHAMVYALSRSSEGREVGSVDIGEGDEYLSIWSKQAAGSSDDSSNWAYLNGLSTESGKFTSDKKAENGFELTQSWLALPLVNEKDFVSVMRNILGGAPALPSNTTDWFVLSLSETIAMNEFAATLNPIFAAVGGEALWSGAPTSDKYIGYWTSSMRARNAVYGYTTETPDGVVAYINSRVGYFRLALAF